MLWISGISTCASELTAMLLFFHGRAGIVESRELRAGAVIAWDVLPSSGKCWLLFRMGLMSTYESDSIWLTAILGRLSGWLDEGYVFESKVGVVSVCESKILSASVACPRQGRKQ